jgi:hypothetical protein
MTVGPVLLVEGNSTVVWYSTAYDRLAANNRFRFQDNALKVNSVQESMCNVFAPVHSACSPLRMEEFQLIWCKVTPGDRAVYTRP